MRFVYSLAFYLATPLILLHFAWRGRKDRRWLERWDERFGSMKVRGPRECILIHAASVGEVNAASALIQGLLDKNIAPIFVSTFTPTGSQRLQSLFGDRISHAYLPLDLPGACRQFLKALSPRLMVVMETEVWPNLFHVAGDSGIPVLIANGQISTRSLRSYRRFAALTRSALSHVSLVLAASEEDARRFVACGANAKSVRASGNIKFDLELPGSIAEQGSLLRQAWGRDRHVIVTGSSHEADESIILEAYASALEVVPDALLVLVPRHPERFDAAAAAANASGFEVVLYSQERGITASTQCLVLDVMGKLQAAYAAADLAIIGGSFSDIGGHNPLEAAMLGVPVLTGPDMSGQQQISDALVARNAARPVPDAHALGAAIIELLSDERLRREMGESARNVVEENRGALQRSLQAIDDLLGRTPDGARHEN